MNSLLIAIGGAIGSVARYTITTAVSRVAPAAFPFGTFAVNLAGCVALGMLVAVGEQRGLLSTASRAFLLVGLLGGFTTFSTFALENVQLLRSGEIVYAALNTSGQVLLGIGGLWLGFLMAWRLT